MKQITTDYVQYIITPRPADLHKGQAGRVLIIAGSRGMAGAAVLASRGALYSGAGLVKVSVPDELFNILQISVPEAMCIDREEAAKADLSVYDAICIGPGIGTGEDAMSLLYRVMSDYSGPMVIDADGINCLCRYGALGEIKQREGITVFTPHPGEANRMLDSLGFGSYKELGREGTAAALAAATGAIVLLKGPETLVSDGENTYVNPTGNPGGIITSLLAQKHLSADQVDRVNAAAFLHGLAGDIAAENIGEYGMTSADIADAVAAAFNAL